MKKAHIFCINYKIKAQATITRLFVTNNETQKINTKLMSIKREIYRIEVLLQVSYGTFEEITIIFCRKIRLITYDS